MKVRSIQTQRPRLPHFVSLSGAVLMAVAVLSSLLVGCTPRPPGREPDMSLARVRDYSQSGDRWSLMLEVPDGEHARVFGDKADYRGYDVASATVTDGTVLVKSEANQLVEASMAEVLDAEHLSVWFEGPVAESYPVQATAGYIQITE